MHILLLIHASEGLAKRLRVEPRRRGRSSLLVEGILS
jgi:hypothetical protein